VKFLIAACCIVAMFPSLAPAQTQVYGVVAPGVRHDIGAPTIEIGGGIERRAYYGFAVALNLGWLKAKNSKGWAPVVRLNAEYAWTRVDHPRLVPFVAVGLALAPLFDTPGGFTFGGGVNVWARDNVGLRMAFRDDVFIGTRKHHYCSVPIGVIGRFDGGR